MMMAAAASTDVYPKYHFDSSTVATTSVVYVCVGVCVFVHVCLCMDGGEQVEL